MKPNLTLKEKDFLNEKLHKTKKFALNLKSDLIAVLEFMIANEDNLKINFSPFEYQHRCVSGWWAYWLGIYMIGYDNHSTDRFKNIFCNAELWDGFVLEDNNITHYIKIFFENDDFYELPERLKIAESLQIKIFPDWEF